MPIRIRLALLFALGTGAIVLLASAAFVRLLGSGLEASVDSGLRTRADALAQTVAGDAAVGVAQRPLPDGFAQLFDPAGHLVSSTGASGVNPLLASATVAHARTARIFLTVTLPERSKSSIAGEKVRLSARPLPRGGGTWVVVVGDSLEAADNAVGRVRTAALFGGPVAVLLAGLAGWLLASAALYPVDRMRREVDAMSVHDDGAIAVPDTRDEISALAETMNGLLRRLRGALVRERAFVADAGHELRTPLAILRGELELASRPGRSHLELAQAVASAAEETERLSRLAEDLLLLARSDDGAGQLQKERTDVEAVLAPAVDRARVVAGDRGVTVELDVDGDVIANVDAARLRQAVDNVLDNAVSHAPRDTTVVVAARVEHGTLVIEVTDHGPGFPLEFLPHAFERLRRADSARSRSDGGAGIGLAIVQSVVGAHGGTATVANRPEGGAIARLEIP